MGQGGGGSRVRVRVVVVVTACSPPSGQNFFLLLEHKYEILHNILSINT